MMSVLDIFKIGIGPSSSHTVGPMKIANDFVRRLGEENFSAEKITVELHGSLALTGRGHKTDDAAVLGLSGFDPETIDLQLMPRFIEQVKSEKKLPLSTGLNAFIEIPFDWEKDIVFAADYLPLHENGMRLTAHGSSGSFSRVYYSTGGGFFKREENYLNDDENAAMQNTVPYPYRNASDLVRYCVNEAISVSGLALANELAFRSREELDQRLEKIWQVMKEAIERGMKAEGLLPGSLKVPRRAVGLWRRLKATNALSGDPMAILDWVNMFAFAVSEENAASGRVVTAPTLGACGVIPAVLAYYDKFVCALCPETQARFLLTSGTIGILYKTNASISGAEVGCQGEIGVACSMAAAGLADLMGGSPDHVCSAAQIAMEHNLGLTCDPVAGLVQIPCIERNAVMAVKAINAARMAMARTTAPKVLLDKTIETMFETGRDMDYKYRETSKGGLAKSLSCE
ncbi:MAG: L-serine ammonia-lyase [Treponema sp.]|nr:L-serine ammonia-lyase [Treponema sp.]